MTLVCEASTVQFPLVGHAVAVGWQPVKPEAVLGKRRGEEDVLFYDELKAALNDLFQTLLHKLMTAEIRVNHFDIDMSEVGG